MSKTTLFFKLQKKKNLKTDRYVSRAIASLTKQPASKSGDWIVRPQLFPFSSCSFVTNFCLEGIWEAEREEGHRITKKVNC